MIIIAACILIVWGTAGMIHHVRKNDSIGILVWGVVTIVGISLF